MDRIEQGIKDGKWSRESVNAFNLAVETGRLSLDRNDSNYAGNYMYMGLNQGKDAFKNIMTRAYDV